MRAVSGETSIYERLLLWATWATDRRDVPIRHDAFAAGFDLAPDLFQELEDIRSRNFPESVYAMDLAVATLRIEHGDPDLFRVVVDYFLKWEAVETISKHRNMSEHHVVTSLQRAMRYLSHHLEDPGA